MTCKCKGTGRRDGFSEYLDCMEPGCNAAVERAEFNKRLKEAGSMSVEDAAWWGRQNGISGLLETGLLLEIAHYASHCIINDDAAADKSMDKIKMMLQRGA